MPEKRTIYICSICGTSYPTEEKAIECEKSHSEENNHSYIFPNSSSIKLKF